jgi:uncharacterized membrane protein
MRSVFLGTVIWLLAVSPASAQTPGQTQALESSLTIEKAQVLEVKKSETRLIPGTQNHAIYQTLTARILSGPQAGKMVTVENDYLSLTPGQKFFLTHTVNQELDLDAYAVLEPDRLPALGLLLAAFVLATVLIGGWTGLRGLLALIVSILLVFYALLPGIASGYNPIFIAAAVAGLIVIFGSYVTHGVNRTTSAAVMGLVLTVVVTALLTHFAIAFAQLSGFAEDSTVALNFASGGTIDFVGLLLAAMLIGALGILYDAAIGQAVAVEELFRAAPNASRAHIFTRAMRIGREHIGALVNTLAIAYVGASLPILLLFKTYGEESFLFVINHELFATEIVRAVTGSIGILLTVPISTAAAIVLLMYSSKKRVL